MKLIPKILFSLLFIFNILFSQDRYKSIPTWVKSVPEYGLSGVSNTITDKSNLIIISAIGLSALVAHKYEKTFQNYSQREGLMPDRLAQFGDLYGGTWSMWLMPVSIIITSKVTDESNREMLEKLEYATSALVANGVTTLLLKKIIDKERPNGNNFRSMPSGHTSHSFAVAAVAHEIYGQKVGIAAYLLAIFVAASRIHDNKHYLSDVIIGAGLGTITGRGFAKTYQEHKYSVNSQLNLNISINF